MHIYAHVLSMPKMYGDSITLFSVSLKALCGGNITSMNGTIFSPGHPAEYPNFQDCVWSVRVPPGNGIYINFTVLSTEPIYDYITVW